MIGDKGEATISLTLEFQFLINDGLSVFTDDSSVMTDNGKTVVCQRVFRYSSSETFQNFRLKCAGFLISSLFLHESSLTAEKI